MMILRKLFMVCSVVCNFIMQQVAAQYTLQISVSVPPGSGNVYLSGSFNNWDPGNKNYQLSIGGNGKREIILKDLKAGEYKYKLTRGNPATIECSAMGTNIKPRNVHLTKDTALQVIVTAWSDAYFSFANMPDSLLSEAMTGRAGYYLEIDLDSSYKYALQLYGLAKKLHSPLREARALDLQAAIFTKQGNGEKALELLLKSLAIKRLLNDSSGGTSFTYAEIGKVYEGMQDYNNAKENYLLSTAWLNETNKVYKCASLAAIGNLFYKEGNTDSASIYVGYALQFNPAYFGALLLLGDIESKNGNYVTALNCYRAAATNSSRGTPGTALYQNALDAYKSIAIAFDHLDRKDSAYYYARKAFEIASKVNSPAAMAGTSKVLVGLFKKDQQYDSAYFYQQLLTQQNERIFSTEKNKQIHNIYFNEKLRQQDATALEEKYHLNIKIYALAGLAFLLIVIGIGYRVRLKNRFYKQLSEIEMRALRAQMNPHFIFNCLASINRYIVKSDTKTASAYLTKFSKLIRLILDNSANEAVTIDAEIQTLKLYLDMESLRFGGSFQYEIQTDKITQSDSTAIPAMIVQPYIENAIWHGLLQRPTGPPGKLWLRFAQMNQHTLRIEIEDNGIGRKKAAELRSKDTIKSKSYGMQISKDRIQIINSQYRSQSSVTVEDLFDNAGNAVGTKVILQLPLIEMAEPAVR